jgi:hypothetical protein
LAIWLDFSELVMFTVFRRGKECRLWMPERQYPKGTRQIAGVFRESIKPKAKWPCRQTGHSSHEIIIGA